VQTFTVVPFLMLVKKKLHCDCLNQSYFGHDCALKFPETFKQIPYLIVAELLVLLCWAFLERNFEIFYLLNWEEEIDLGGGNSSMVKINIHSGDCTYLPLEDKELLQFLLEDEKIVLVDKGFQYLTVQLTSLHEQRLKIWWQGIVQKQEDA
jgi:hypothetical protein